jgi:hypothetical protein
MFRKGCSHFKNALDLLSKEANYQQYEMNSLLFCFSLTETKRRLVVKSTKLFDSPLVAYEALKNGRSITTIRHKTKVRYFNICLYNNLSPLMALLNGTIDY